jgi:hypothetical protein
MYTLTTPKLWTVGKEELAHLEVLLSHLSLALGWLSLFLEFPYT